MGAGRRHETPGSETEGFITHCTVVSLSSMLLSAHLVPMGRICEAVQIDSTHTPMAKKLWVWVTSNGAVVSLLNLDP